MREQTERSNERREKERERRGKGNRGRELGRFKNRTILKSLSNFDATEISFYRRRNDNNVIYMESKFEFIEEDISFSREILDFIENLETFKRDT